MATKISSLSNACARAGFPREALSSNNFEDQFAVSYQVTSTDVRATLASAAEHLAPGGLFVFDVWYSQAVYAKKPEVRIKRLAGNGLDILRIAEPDVYPNENRVDVRYTLFVGQVGAKVCQTFTEMNSMRHFSLPELDTFAEYAEFEWVDVEEFISGAIPNESTWGVYLIWRRIKIIKLNMRLVS